MLPNLIMKATVEHYVNKGANLMWPGVLSVDRLGDYKEGQIVALTTYEGDIVGVARMKDKQTT